MAELTEVAQFLLPDLGEGLEEAQLVQWLVQAGDYVSLNQPLCQVETAKALVDVPSPFTGTIEKLHAGPGDTVLVGHPLVTFQHAIAAAPDGASSATDAASSGGHGPILVGYGTDGPAQSFSRRRRSTAGSSISADSADPSTAPETALAPAPEGVSGRASPLVRKMAEERGIDLSAIRGSGPGGRIRVEDLPPLAAAPAVGLASGAAEEDEQRISTVGLRKAIAARMMRAATTIPHFTEYTLFDAGELVSVRERLRQDQRFAEAKLTYLPFFVRAVVEAVRAYPIMNSRWDEDRNEIVIKHSIHVGIATDTARGLLVPVIHHAERLDLGEIAAEANRLIELARSGRAPAADLSGGSITITNVGAAGPVDTGAPLINPPEACVVGFGALKPRPTVVGDSVLVRPGAWISISCDHRIVDGATAAQFMGELVKRLESPETLT